MRQYVMHHNIYRWAANILGDLRELRLQSPAAGTLVQNSIFSELNE